MTTEVAVLAVLLAIGAAAASIASAAKLTLSESGVALAPADSFEVFGVENLSVTTSSGSIECEDFSNETRMRLGVVTNSKAKDKLEIEHLSGARLHDCRSFTGNTVVELESLAGPLKLGANGGASTGPVTVFVFFEHVTYQDQEYRGVECFFTHKSLSGSNSATPTRQKLELELGGELKLNVAASSMNARHVCPKTADVEVSFPSSESLDGELGAMIEQQTS